MKIYVAGKMEWLNEEDSTWRRSLDVQILDIDQNGKPTYINLSRDIELILPSCYGFDHGGDLVNEIVDADIKLVEEADGVIAVFTSKEQTGTIVELLHALDMGKPCLAIFVHPMVSLPCGEIEKIEARGESDYYWFLVNYLRKHLSASCFAVANKEMAFTIARKWLHHRISEKTPKEVR